MQRKRMALALFVACATGAVAASAPGASGSTHSIAAAVDPLLRPLAGADSGTFPGAEVTMPEIDNTGPRLALTPAVTRAYAALGGHTSVSWTQFGTPRTMVRDNGTYLATGLTGTPEAEARGWLVDHAALFGLTDTSTSALQTWYSTNLANSEAKVVVFRQRAGGYNFAESGLIGIGVTGGKIASVTSSAVPTALIGTVAAAPRLSALQAVVAAAKDDGITTKSWDFDALKVSKIDSAGFTEIVGKGLADVQRARLEVLPTTNRGAKLVWTTDVTDVAGAHALATISYVDALDSSILMRHDEVKTDDDSADAATVTTAAAQDLGGEQAIQAVARPAARPADTSGTFSTTYTATVCSAYQVLPLDTGTATVVVTATATDSPTDDIKIELKTSRDGKVSEYDTLTNPEEANQTFSPPLAAGETVSIAICPNTGSAGGAVSGTFVTSTMAISTGIPGIPATPNLPVTSDVNGPATYKFFQDSPVHGYTTAGATADNRSTACGPQPTTIPSLKATPACDVTLQTAVLPDSYDTVKGAPTMATIGNNAIELSAQESTSLTPGAPGTPYTSATRDYTPAYSDQWKSSQCDPTTLVGTDPADIDAARVNLFLGHNRIHDFAYKLGLNDKTGSLQTSNATSDGANADPETGSAQNAAATDLALRQLGPVYTEAGIGLTGRNNANQITMQDGVPGLTNQYLFEPVLGFYGPCSDGDLDSSVFLHEYTHAISNRLIAGPDTSLSGQEGGSMGESWSDLDAIEFLNEFGVAGTDGSDRYSEGAFVTGDEYRGIRDYNLGNNPLTYGEFGFDTTGAEVHADGEIWNGIQFNVRQAMIDSWNAKGIPDSNKVLQKACALGEDTSGKPVSQFDGCPGNRRWIQYVYDSLILQMNGAPTFVDMKNTELAGALMRNSQDDYTTMATAFAQRGVGTNSSALDGTDTDPVPGFASPNTATNAHVTFALKDSVTGASVPGDVYVGTFTARATPLASTAGTKYVTSGKVIPSSADMTAGTYSFVVQAPGYGLQRLSATFAAGQTATQTFTLARNFASASSGATATADQDGSVRAKDLIDDSEATDTGYAGSAPAGKSWTVALGGGSHTIQRISVSALHHPVDTTDATDFQARIIDLRAFDVMGSSDGGKTYSTIYSSPDDFFPAKAPRTLAPDVNLRTVTLPAPVTVDHVRLVVRSTQCTGSPVFTKSIANDPLNDAACPDNTTDATEVTASELEVFAPATVGAAATVTTPVKKATKVTKKATKKTVKKAAVKKVTQPKRTLAFTGAPTGAFALGFVLLLLALGLGLLRRRGRRLG